MTIDKYAQDGVNIEEGDSFSSYAGSLCRQTYGNSPHVKIRDFSQGNFRGPRGFSFINLPKGCVNTVAPDGIGTKVVLIDAAQTYKLAARDVVGTTSSDITRWGGRPLVFSNVLDVNTLGQKGEPVNAAARQVIEGAYDAVSQIGCVMLTGETAELGLCVNSENPEARLKFNWAGFMTGVYHPDKMILGNTLQPGQIIMALKENGFRSNGISSARKALKIQYGEKWWDNPAAQADIRACAEPSVLYDDFFNRAHGWNNPNDKFEPIIKMDLIVHLSGGAFESKFANDILFPQNLSAVLDNLFEPPEIMKKCAKWRGMSEEECYKTWHGGQGMIVVIDKKYKKWFLEWTHTLSITAQQCGVITKRTKPQVIIESKFGKGKTIVFKPKPKTKN